MVSLGLIFLFLLPLSFPPFFHQSSVFVKGDDALIQKTCQSTQYPNLCVSTLKSNPTSQKTDTKGLAVLVITVGMSNASDTSSFISDKLLKNATNPTLKKVLQSCSDKYMVANKALEGSINDLSSDDYDSAALQVNAAADYPNSCHNVFKGSPGFVYPSELAQREVVLERLCAVANGIINLLA